MSRARQLGKIVFSLGGLCLSFYSIPGQWSPFNEGPRPRWRGVLAGTGKNLGATGAYVSERADARRPACTCSGMRKEGDRREGEGWPGEARAVVVQKGERRPNTARTKLWDSFRSAQAILYYEVSPSILATPSPPPPQRSLIPRALEMKPNFSATSTLSPVSRSSPRFVLQPRFPSLPLCPVEESKGVLWGWIEGAGMAGTGWKTGRVHRCREGRRTRPERNVSEEHPYTGCSVYSDHDEYVAWFPDAGDAEGMHRALAKEVCLSASSSKNI